MPKKKCATRARKDGTKYQGCWTESAEETKKKPKKKKITFIPKAEGDATRKKAGDFLSSMEGKGSKVSKAVSKTKDVKPKPKPKPSQAERMTGKTKEQMNQMSPEELFGMLPKTARKTVLDPKITGVKVAPANLEQQLDFAEKETSRLEKLGIAKYSGEKGLTAKKLKERIKAVNKYTSVSGTKAELIERLAWQEAMKKMNTSNLRDKVMAERTEKRKKGEEEGRQTKKREIAQAKIAGVRPTQDQMNEMRRENAQRNIGLSMMTGGRYGNIRADSDLNFAHRHRVALSWQGGGFDF